MRTLLFSVVLTARALGPNWFLSLELQALFNGSGNTIPVVAKTMPEAPSMLNGVLFWRASG
jgi:hypothetical protein